MNQLRFLTTITACVMLVLMGEPAHAASLYLGLCDGEMNPTGVSKTGSGTIEVACVLPASIFGLYEGARLTGIRVGLTTVEGISNVKGWVRTSLEAENLCTATFDEPVVGWNELQFDAPTDYRLKVGENLVIGYQFDQSKSTKCIALGGPQSADCYWLARNGKWQDASTDAPGALCVELIVEGDMVPATNLGIESCTYNPLVKYGEDFVAQIVVRNLAKNPIEGYRCWYQTGDADVLDEMDRSHVTLQYRERDTIDFVMGPEVQMPDEVRFEVPFFAIAEGDEIAQDNKCTIYRSNYTQSFPHLLLMEEFTTEECGNCPRAINTLAQMVNEGYEFAQISHHVGYYTDFLTVDEDKTYLWLYGDDGSFAPAGMFDRTFDPDFHTVTARSYPVFSIGYADSFRPALEKAIAMPAFARVEPTAHYDADSRQLTVEVEVEKSLTLDALTQEPRLTVILTEDSIAAQHQAGISSDTFRHRHVYRKCLTEMWGDVLKWDDETHARVQLQYVLPDEWNAEKVEVVALVNNYNPEDRNDCRVYNTGTVSLCPHGEQAIITVRTDRAGAGVCYNLMGQRVARQGLTTDVPLPAGGVCVLSGRPYVVR